MHILIRILYENNVMWSNVWEYEKETNCLQLLKIIFLEDDIEKQVKGRITVNNGWLLPWHPLWPLNTKLGGSLC